LDLTGYTLPQLLTGPRRDPIAIGITNADFLTALASAGDHLGFSLRTAGSSQTGALIPSTGIIAGQLSRTATPSLGCTPFFLGISRIAYAFIDALFAVFTPDTALLTDSNLYPAFPTGQFFRFPESTFALIEADLRRPPGLVSRAGQFFETAIATGFTLDIAGRAIAIGRRATHTPLPVGFTYLLARITGC